MITDLFKDQIKQQRGNETKICCRARFLPETTLTYASVHTLHALWPPNSLSVQCTLQSTHDSFITSPETQKTTNTQVVKQFLGFLHVS